MSEGVIQENLPTPLQLNPPVRFEFFLIFVKVLIAVMFMFPLAHYSMFGENLQQEVQIDNHNETLKDTIQVTENLEVNKTKKIKMRTIIQPSCPISYLRIILEELCEDYMFRAASCTPEDFENLEKHKIPVSSARSVSAGDARANIVGFLTSGLLIASLIAAFLELYKAKKQVPTKTKAPLTRKCSLADLTVLKHHRKEMIRKDSILEGHEEAKQPAHYKKAPPLQRSSSTPAEFINEFSAYNVFNRSLDSRRESVVDNQQFATYVTQDPTNIRSNPDGRRCSILDSRKLSYGDGKFIDKYDFSGKRIPLDITSSPERRHHSRLVHRH